MEMEDEENKAENINNEKEVDEDMNCSFNSNKQNCDNHDKMVILKHLQIGYL